MTHELNLIEKYILLIDELYDLNRIEKKYINDILESIYHLRKELKENEKYTNLD